MFSTLTVLQGHLRYLLTQKLDEITVCDMEVPMSPEQAQSPNINATHVPLSEQDAEHLGALQRHSKVSRTFPSMARLTKVPGLSSTGVVLNVMRRIRR